MEVHKLLKEKSNEEITGGLTEKIQSLIKCISNIVKITLSLGLKVHLSTISLVKWSLLWMTSATGSCVEIRKPRMHTTKSPSVIMI